MCLPATATGRRSASLFTQLIIVACLCTSFLNASPLPSTSPSLALTNQSPRLAKRMQSLAAVAEATKAGQSVHNVAEIRNTAAALQQSTNGIETGKASAVLDSTTDLSKLGRSKSLPARLDPTNVPNSPELLSHDTHNVWGAKPEVTAPDNSLVTEPKNPSATPQESSTANDLGTSTEDRTDLSKLGRSNSLPTRLDPTKVPNSPELLSHDTHNVWGAKPDLAASEKTDPNLASTSASRPENSATKQSTSTEPIPKPAAAPQEASNANDLAKETAAIGGATDLSKLGVSKSLPARLDRADLNPLSEEEVFHDAKPYFSSDHPVNSDGNPVQLDKGKKILEHDPNQASTSGTKPENPAEQVSGGATQSPPKTAAPTLKALQQGPALQEAAKSSRLQALRQNLVAFPSAVKKFFSQISFKPFRLKTPELNPGTSAKPKTVTETPDKNTAKLGDVSSPRTQAAPEPVQDAAPGSSKNPINVESAETSGTKTSEPLQAPPKPTAETVPQSPKTADVAPKASTVKPDKVETAKAPSMMQRIFRTLFRPKSPSKGKSSPFRLRKIFTGAYWKNIWAKLTSLRKPSAAKKVVPLADPTATAA